jgi:hypothetical protein
VRSILKKLIQILAVSAGGGLLFGAGMRLAEKREGASGTDSEIVDERISLFLDRLEAVERRINFEISDAAEATGTAESGSSETGIPEARLQKDIQAEITAQISAMEARLKRDLGERSEQRIKTLGDTLQARIEHRLEPIEAEISAQRSSVEELREYSVKTDRSLQKLLEGVDKLLSAQSSRHS